MTTTVGGAQYINVKSGTLLRRESPKGPVLATIVLPPHPLVFGRAPGVQISLEGDTSVSNMHAEISVTPEGVRLRDLGSRNGTHVDGLRIEAVRLTRPCYIVIGKALFEFVPGEDLPVETGTADRFGGLIGTSPLMKKLFYELEKVAMTDHAVLITGESGTGKELIAHAIHEASRRSKRPFELINCATLSPALAESELFGHERNAFTGAERARISPLAEADGGSAFFDEIGELSLQLQPLLLRFMQEGTFKPVGSNTHRHSNVRIIAATWRELDLEVNKGTFRSDLLFRLNTLHVQVPPLRKRPEDIPLLIEHFAQDPSFLKRIPDGSLAQILKWGFPGNVRELKNIVLRASTFTEPHEPVYLERFLGERGDVRNSLPEYEVYKRLYWKTLHKDLKGNVSKIAKQANVDRETARKWLKMYKIEDNDDDE